MGFILFKGIVTRLDAFPTGSAGLKGDYGVHNEIFALPFVAGTSGIGEMTMTKRVDKSGLQVAAELATFIDERVLPATGLKADAFWKGTAELFGKFAPQNRALLATRDDLQAKIDTWHQTRAGKPIIAAEIAASAGPQLVVPVLNARFVLNAANARWGSLYDALYGTDAIEPPVAGGYSAERGAKVIAWAKAFLDRSAPLASGSWTEWTGAEPKLKGPAEVIGRNGDNWLIKNNGLHIELVIDRSHRAPDRNRLSNDANPKTGFLRMNEA